MSRGTPQRTFRVADDLWLPFAKLAARLGFTPSEVLRECMRRVVATRGKWFEAQDVAATRGDDLDALLIEFLHNYIEGPP